VAAVRLQLVVIWKSISVISQLLRKIWWDVPRRMWRPVKRE